jgi:hypothetical protein
MRMVQCKTQEMICIAVMHWKMPDENVSRETIGAFC